MSEIDFQKCSESDLNYFVKHYDLKLRWMDVENLFIILSNAEPIGLIQISMGMYGVDTYQIDNFETFEKDKGFGRMILKNILNDPDFKGKTLYLYTNTENSKRFWENNGFETVDDGTGVPIQRLAIT